MMTGCPSDKKLVYTVGFHGVPIGTLSFDNEFHWMTHPVTWN